MPEAPAEPLFAWLHLSDLHVGRGEAGATHGRRLVLDEVARDLARGGERSWPKLDAIFVTGDIARTGATSEYDEAREQLAKIADAAGVSMKSVFVVPGNHDVDRSAGGDKYTKRLLKALRAGEESLDAALAEDGDRAALQKRLDAYLAFAAGLAPGCANLFWVKSIAGRVQLVGLNTALLAGGDEDRGKLRLGREQLAGALLGAGEGDPVVVLSHHPFGGGWLADENDADKWMARDAHLHLFGHGDHVRVEEASTGGGGHLVRIAAGGRGYSIGALVRGEGGGLAVRVWPRRWSDANNDFREDVDAVPRGERFAEHALRWPRRADEEEKERKGAKAQRRKKAVWEGAGGVPVAEVPHFLGRDEEMTELREALAKDEAVCVVATGLGGIGKTSLVRQLVAKHGAEMFPDGSVWIDAMTLEGDVARVCKRFGYEGERPRTLVEAARFLAGELHEQRVLVVIDNVSPDQIDVSALPVVGGKARTVITSRAITLHESLGMPARPLGLGRWSLEACRAYIREVVPSLGSSDKDIDALATFVDRLPLAVRLIARSLQHQGTPVSLLARLQAEALGTLDKVAKGADRGVAATFKLSYDELGETGCRVLLALAACARVTSERIVARVAGLGEHDVGDALADLAERSLAECVSREAGLWTLHDVVRLFVRAQPEMRQADEAHLAFAEQHVEAHQDPLDWTAMEAGVDEVLAAVGRLLKDGEVSRATSLLYRVDSHMMQRGRYAELVASYEHLAARLPESSKELAMVLGDAGVCYRMLGDISKAIEHHQRALTVDEALGHLEGQARHLGNLGICHNEQCDIPTAIEHHQRALTVDEALGHLERQAQHLGNLGICYWTQGDIPKAIEHHQRALALDERLGVLEGQAASLGNLGVCYSAQGDVPKAIEHHQRALALNEKLGRVEGQAIQLHNLGDCHETQGDLPRALDHFRRSLALKRRIGLPDHHPDVRDILAALTRLTAPPTP